MFYIGIDPGLIRTGYAFISTDLKDFNVICSGIISPNPLSIMSERLFTLGQEMYSKLLTMRKEIADNGEELSGIMLEKTIVNANASSSLSLAAARGVLQAACAQAFPFFKISEISPSAMKKVLTGIGTAEKSEIKRRISEIYNIPEPKYHDEADALGMAYCAAIGEGEGVNENKSYSARKVMQRARYHKLRDLMPDNGDLFYGNYEEILNA